jgi:hypothetical protein
MSPSTAKRVWGGLFSGRDNDDGPIGYDVLAFSGEKMSQFPAWEVARDQYGRNVSWMMEH